ncbi:hypothetical protein [Gimesia algae]|uniref:RING-type domain-containing protein n=1 Tax=Gimesia algae TaxID=2527971 RepID=A0A517V6M8_9PLAN|nr:hypothetical protein [Gimesia algae]QDT88655.1 hypothetical protein Pan161_02730 [Gimesia algae]
MKTTKTQFAVLCAMLCSLMLSQRLPAEESYERFTVRNWTYRDGTEATGKLITVKGPTATLSLKGEGTVYVPLEKLSVKDLNWIYEYHKRKKLLSFLPPEYRKPQKEFVKGSEPDTSPPAKPASTQPASEPTPEKPAPESMPAETAKPSVEEESFKPFTVREFTLKDGTRHQAKLLSVSSQGKVTLLKDAGGSVRVPLDDLSEKDVAWIIEYHRHNNLVALLPESLKAKAGEPGAKVGSSDAPLKMEAGAVVDDASKTTKADTNPDVEKVDTEIDPQLVAALNEYRVWTDKQGKKSEVRFMRINGREVVFLGKPVGFINVHIGTLIPDDLKLLRDALKMHGRFDEIPLAYREDPDPSLSPTRLKQFMQLNFQRKWTDLSGNSVAASYVKMEDGNVTLLITKTGMVQDFPYQNFCAEDQIYVQERLQKEIPGNFFPALAEETVLSLTPEEREKEFRIWTDLSKRQIKGKFVRLAYGDSVAVLNTGEKEELFITDFFSAPDMSLIKPRKQTDQLAMNQERNPGFPGQTGMGGRNPFPNMPAESPQMNAPRMPTMQYEIECNFCNKKHVSDTPVMLQCPHCGGKAGESIYICGKCGKKFRSTGFSSTAPCPHCNQGRQDQQVAANNRSPFPASSNNDGAGSSVGSGSSAYRSGRAMGKVFAWILMFVGLIAGAMRLRG